ncbi:MAG: hypothetical protein HYZ37_03235 [Candidatus Solibacter usitatus]|nr:hypothetical protein [Candidatus Solibacter usitatus]
MSPLLAPTNFLDAHLEQNDADSAQQAHAGGNRAGKSEGLEEKCGNGNECDEEKTNEKKVVHVPVPFTTLLAVVKLSMDMIRLRVSHHDAETNPRQSRRMKD